MIATVATVLFDLDGTLVDTAPDMAYALNALLVERDRAPLAFETIRPVVSHGAMALIRLGFGIDDRHPDFAALRTRFLEIYRSNLCRDTRLFPGMEAVLASLEARRMRYGIVTNKPAFLTEPLVEQLGLKARLACVVSGDSTAHRKPHPEPMLFACRTAGSQPGECLYIGDAERDIVAGRTAGLQTLVALFGYIGDADRPRDWGADGLLETPEQLLDWLDRNG